MGCGRKKQMKKKCRTSDEAQTIQIKDEYNRTVLTVTAWGRFNKLGGRATIRVGCATCCDGEDATIDLKEAHRVGRLLLNLKPAASLKEMMVDA